MNYKYLYLSKPDFVFFFDPKLEIQTKVATNIKDAMFIKVGFMKEGEVNIQKYNYLDLEYIHYYFILLKIKNI